MNWRLGANLAICVLYGMVVIALSGDRQGRLDLGGDGAFLLLVFLSPPLLWAVIAWVAARMPRMSTLSLLVSAPLMVVGLVGHYGDWKSFHDSVPGQEAQSIAGFLGMVLQWAVGAVWFVVVVVALRVSWFKSGMGSSPVRDPGQDAQGIGGRGSPLPGP